MKLDTILTQLALEPTASFDVAEAALLLAHDEYPQLDVEAVLSEIDAMAREARTYVRGSLTAQVTGLCRYLFHEMGFHGNVNDYYNPANSYLHLVLERRTGIPITLTALTMAVGQRAGLRIEGVGLPGHFIAKAMRDEEELFFDPFHGGRLLTAADCENLAQQSAGVAFTATAASLQALPLGYLMQRMLNNLKGVYLAQEDFTRATRVLERLCQLDTATSSQRRDLGVCYMHLAQPGKALTHLAAYLRAFPQADDADNVQQLVRTAQRALAAWN